MAKHQNKNSSPGSGDTRLLKAKREKAVPAGRKLFPIVAVGASAGGLEAFTELLQHLPVDLGMAFVLLQHLDPTHPSALPDILQRATQMPVLEVANDQPVEANHVYVGPPNAELRIEKGALQLSRREKKGGVSRLIDSFFESLANDLQERAIGVVLSGTASDGTCGLEAIKAEGGITFAQDESARYDSMPRSAIASGCVDYTLPPKEIARELTEIGQHLNAEGRPVPPSDVQPSSKPEKKERLSDTRQRLAADDGQRQSGRDKSYNEILLLLRNHTGVDFSFYKTNTIERRIGRRLLLSRIKSLEAYTAFLKGNAAELDALYSDILINITSFFRNPDAFEALKKTVFPKLTPKTDKDTVRIWVVACSTGQEAYSIAMSLMEFFDGAPKPPRLQIFATDLNEKLLEKARNGLYGRSLVHDVSPERLRRFFTEEEGGYRVNKAVREACVFARHDVIDDPPFSRMDLITCRNLLIYLTPGIQDEIIPMFHYALKQNGFLFLGASESVGAFTGLFQGVDRKHKIFLKKASSTPLMSFQYPARELRARREGNPSSDAPPAFKSENNAQREADRIALKRYAPPAVLIDDDLQVLQFRGSTAPYLSPPTGKANFNILNMAREGLMLPLRTAIAKAKKEGKIVRKDEVHINDGAERRKVAFEVVPLKHLKQRHYLVVFDPESRQGTPVPVNIAPSPGHSVTATAVNRRIAELEAELAETRDYLHMVQEQQVAANEELQASNEEVTSANEELQSINEELETSKEELESTNEELMTVNEEMAHRNDDLRRLNDDLINLHASLNMPILLVTRKLELRRYSGPIENLFDVSEADLGRPLSAIQHHFDVPGLEQIIKKVIDNVKPTEHEVRDRKGHWFMLRVRPYLTMDDKVDGALLLVMDINGIKQAELRAQRERHFAEAIIETTRSPLLVLHSDLRIEKANGSFYKAFQVSPSETEGRPIFDLGNRQWDIPELRELLENVLPKNRFFQNYVVSHDFETIGHRSMLLTANRVDSIEKILVSIEDITERLKAQAAMKSSEVRFRRLFESAHDGILILNADTRKITASNPFMEQLLGCTRAELEGKELLEIGLLKDEDSSRSAFRELRRAGSVRYETVALQPKSGQRRDVEILANLYEEDGTRTIQCNVRDITERKHIDLELTKARTNLERIVQHRTAQLRETIAELEAFSYSVSHDMRAPLRAMRGFIHLLLQGAAPRLNEDEAGYLEKINDAAARMDKLIQDVLDYTRILRSEIRIEPVDLQKLVVQIIKTYPQLQVPGVKIELQDPLPVVMGNEASLTQCISNLLSNAVKFVPPGTAPRIKVWSENIGPDARIWVEDNGVGIPERDLDRIFKMFERVHSSATYEGTGIGLAIVRKAMERMGGKVGVESVVGQGAKFWIQLKRRVNDERSDFVG